MPSLFASLLCLYEEWAEPMWSDNEMPVLMIPGQMLLTFRLDPSGGIEGVDGLTTDHDILFRRSWWAPWKRYAYMRMSESKSDRLIAYFASPFIVVRDGVERLTSVDETSDIIRKHVWSVVNEPFNRWIEPKVATDLVFP